VNDNVFREIDEELRRDRLFALWRRYGRLVISAAIAVVIIAIAKVGWDEYTLRQTLVIGTQYHTATELLGQGNEDTARAAFAMIGKEGGKGYASLARLHEAAVVSAKGDTESAIQIYRAIADDSGTPETLRDLARILGAYRRIDREDPEALVSELEPLTAVGSPWRHSALEIIALIAIRSGEHVKAREIYTSLAADPDTPNMLQQRAEEMSAALSEKL